jgi:hypothetical protein
MVIDFGGKYVKVRYSPNTKRADWPPFNLSIIPSAIAYIGRDPICGVKAWKLKALEDDFVVQDAALTAIAANASLGTQFLGAVFGRSPAYLRAHPGLFGLDANAIVACAPPQLLLERFLQSIAPYAADVKKVIVLVSPHISLPIRDQIQASGRRIFEKKTEVLDHTVVYQKLVAAATSSSWKHTLLFLDFGAFSAKATAIQMTKGFFGLWSQPNVTGYEFSEDAGLEALALRLSQKMNAEREKVVANLPQIENGDPLFEEEVRRIIQWSTHGELLSEVQLLGGGANFAWIEKLVKSIVANRSIPILHNFSAIDAMASFMERDVGDQLPTKPRDVPGISLYVCHRKERFQIKAAIGTIVRYFAFGNIEKGTFSIETDADRVGRGYPTRVTEYEIQNISSISPPLGAGLTMSCRAITKHPYVKRCTLCGDIKCALVSAESDDSNAGFNLVDTLESLQGLLSTFQKYLVELGEL